MTDIAGLTEIPEALRDTISAHVLVRKHADCVLVSAASATRSGWRVPLSPS
jgi:hypothetical protein